MEIHININNQKCNKHKFNQILQRKQQYKKLLEFKEYRQQNIVEIFYLINLQNKTFLMCKSLLKILKVIQLKNFIIFMKVDKNYLKKLLNIIDNKMLLIFLMYKRNKLIKNKNKQKNLFNL